MKITKKELNQIIESKVTSMLNEGPSASRLSPRIIKDINNTFEKHSFTLDYFFNHMKEGNITKGQYNLLKKTNNSFQNALHDLLNGMVVVMDEVTKNNR